MSVPFPHHPEPMVMRWSELEIACITQYAVAVRKDERERCAQELQRLRAHIQEAADDAQYDAHITTSWRDIRDWHLSALQPKEPT